MNKIAPTPQFAQTNANRQPELRFVGSVKEEHIPSLVDLCKGIARDFGVAKTKMNKLARLCVEVLQNAARHASREADEMVTVMVYTHRKDLILVCKNTASLKDALKAQDILGQLSILSVEEIQEHFRASLNTATLSDRGGAGLGLIDITYRAGEVPDFEIVPHENAELCNYAIRTRLTLV